MSEHRLNEIVIERPRSGWRRSSRLAVKTELNRLTQEAIDDGGVLSPYRIKPYGKTKYFSDHLNPLRRYLRSKVGRPWNQVYSELSQKLDKKTVLGKHVIDHLWGFVERHAQIIDGVPYHQPGSHWGRRGGRIGGYYDGFYVHPETGILCYVERSPRKNKQSPNQDRIQIDSDHDYYKIADLWFQVIFAAVDPKDSSYDILLKTHLTPEIARKIYGRPIYAVKKRQCSKAELKKLRSRMLM